MKHIDGKNEERILNHDSGDLNDPQLLTSYK